MKEQSLPIPSLIGLIHFLSKLGSLSIISMFDGGPKGKHILYKYSKVVSFIIEITKKYLEMTKEAKKQKKNSNTK